MLDGELEHRDSTGTDGVIYPGLAQRMSAGRGIQPLRDERQRDRRRAPRADVGAPRHRGHRAGLRAARPQRRARRRRARAGRVGPGPRRARSRSTSATRCCSSAASSRRRGGPCPTRRTCTCSSRSATPSSTARRSRTGDAVRLTDAGSPTLDRGRRRRRGAGLGRRRERRDVVAVDWSGRRAGERRAPLDGRGRRRRAGPASRPAAPVSEVVDELVARVADDRDRRGRASTSRSRSPAWFLDARGYRDGRRAVGGRRRRRRRWLARVRSRRSGAGPAGRRPIGPQQLRRTEATIAAVGGIRPKSTFQIGGAGSVGTGSVRGFPVLARLRAGGLRDLAVRRRPHSAGGGRDLPACVHRRGGEARRRRRGARTSTRAVPGSRRDLRDAGGRRARTRSTPRCRRW